MTTSSTKIRIFHVRKRSFLTIRFTHKALYNFAQIQTMKENPDDKCNHNDEKKRRRRRLLLLLYAHMTSNISLSLFNFNSRTTLLGKLLDNDASRMSKILARWASTIGLLEFLFNPTIGRLSDKIGRRPFMLCSPIACVLLKTWVYFSPSVTSLSFEKIICDGLRTLSGSTMCAGNFISLPFFFFDSD